MKTNRRQLGAWDFADASRGWVEYAAWQITSDRKKQELAIDAQRFESQIYSARRRAERLEEALASLTPELQAFVPTGWEYNARVALDELRAWQSEAEPLYDRLTQAIMDEIDYQVSRGRLPADTAFRVMQRASSLPVTDPRDRGLGAVPALIVAAAVVVAVGLFLVFCYFVIVAMGDILPKLALGAVRIRAAILEEDNFIEAVRQRNAQRIAAGQDPIRPRTFSQEESGIGQLADAAAKAAGSIATVAVVGVLGFLVVQAFTKRGAK